MTESMARPPFEHLRPDTTGRILIPKTEEQQVLNLTDLSAVAAVNNLRVMIRVVPNLDISGPFPVIDVVDWDLEWKPATPEKPWGVFA